MRKVSDVTNWSFHAETVTSSELICMKGAIWVNTKWLVPKFGTVVVILKVPPHSPDSKYTTFAEPIQSPVEFSLLMRMLACAGNLSDVSGLAYAIAGVNTMNVFLSDHWFRNDAKSPLGRRITVSVNRLSTLMPPAPETSTSHSAMLYTFDDPFGV